ncbi:MAG: hypothetical protein RL217_279, partial [Pseudomonadota bacterium]
GEFTAGTGSTLYDFANGNIINASVKVPFVLVNTSFILRLTLTNNGSSAHSETVTVNMPFTVQPVYRQLQNNNDDTCLTQSGRGNCTTNDSTRWTWNPDNLMFINKQLYLNRAGNGNAYCYQINGLTSSTVVCNTANNLSKATFTNGNEFRIGGERVCRYLDWFTYRYNRNDCNTGDRVFKWN